jgi:hypothetical protein
VGPGVGLNAVETRQIEMKNAYTIFFGRTERKRPLGRTRGWWEYKSKTD